MANPEEQAHLQAPVLGMVLIDGLLSTAARLWTSMPSLLSSNHYIRPKEQHASSPKELAKTLGKACMDMIP